MAGFALSVNTPLWRCILCVLFEVQQRDRISLLSLTHTSQSQPKPSGIPSIIHVVNSYLFLVLINPRTLSNRLRLSHQVLAIKFSFHYLWEVSFKTQ